MGKMTILVDLDGTICDWVGGVRAISQTLAHERGLDLQWPDEQTSWSMLPGTPDADTVVRAAMAHPDLYADLEPYPDAVEALNRLRTKHHVRLCSTPAMDNPACASAKYDWVSRHLGQDWASRLILTHDKTLVRGHLLVDDKPEITGMMDPQWTQVVYDQPYNRDSPGPRIHHWGNTEVLNQCLLPV